MCRDRGTWILCPDDQHAMQAPPRDIAEICRGDRSPGRHDLGAISARSRRDLAQEWMDDIRPLITAKPKEEPRAHFKRCAPHPPRYSPRYQPDHARPPLRILSFRISAHSRKSVTKTNSRTYEADEDGNIGAGGGGTIKARRCCCGATLLLWRDAVVVARGCCYGAGGGGTIKARCCCGRYARALRRLTRPACL